MKVDFERNLERASIYESYIEACFRVFLKNRLHSSQKFRARVYKFSIVTSATNGIRLYSASKHTVVEVIQNLLRMHLLHLLKMFLNKFSLIVVSIRNANLVFSNA